MKNPNFPRYPQRGKLGFYGTYSEQDRNDKRQLANVLVDKYNKTINTFKTEKENTEFHNALTKEIYNLLHDTN